MTCESSDRLWDLSNSTAVVVLTDNFDGAPHGMTLHRFFNCEEHPFGVDIAVAVKDTVMNVSSVSVLSLAWPDHGTAGNTKSQTCRGFHKIRVHLREDSFDPEMIPYVDVGIIVAAERFTPS